MPVNCLLTSFIKVLKFAYIRLVVVQKFVGGIIFNDFFVFYFRNTVGNSFNGAHIV